jgi:rod shape-determining protein MreB
MLIVDWIIGLFSKDMGIDLGTANTLVCVAGKDEIISEPSVVAVKKGTNKVLMNGEAVGTRAKEMGEKAPPSIQVIRPLKDGVIADFDITEAMLRYFIRKVHNRRGLFNPRIVIAIPSGITPVEKRAVFNSAQRAGARTVYLIEEPKAAGIGAGLPITEPVGSMIVDRAAPGAGAHLRRRSRIACRPHRGRLRGHSPDPRSDPAGTRRRPC